MGRFIVLEGLDGVGKSTLARALAEQPGWRYMTTPGAEFNEFRSLIAGAAEGDQLGRALFYATTVSFQGQKALSDVKKGFSVVMDRYWPSTLAYAKARGVKVDLESLTPGFVEPDLVVLITLDEAERRCRLQKRGMTAEDVETLCHVFSQSVMNELEPRCDLHIDVTGLDLEGAAKKVARVIQPFLR